MRSRLLWRRVATAAGIYGSVALGFLGTVIAARALGPHAFGALTVVLAATGFAQVLLDLTVDEALVKYGFRYVERRDFGRLRRLFARAFALKLLGGALAGAALLALAPFARSVFGADGLVAPLLLAALLPLVQTIEPMGGVALVWRGRYDLRAWFLLWSQALRLAGLAVGAQLGVTQAVLGILVAQVAASASIGAVGVVAFRRFPRVPAEPLGADRREIVRFVVQSSVGSGIVSLRSSVGPVLLKFVAPTAEIAYFRTAQAPQQGLASLTAPARLIFLAEQTRDWERGRPDRVFATIRRYTLAAAAACAVLVPIAYWQMPALVRGLFGARYAPAGDAARLVLLAAAIQLVLAWTKSFPVTIGRPELRLLTEAAATVAFVPLVVVLGARWHATGAGGAVLASSVVFALAWAVVYLRLRRDPTLRVGRAPEPVAP